MRQKYYKQKQTANVDCKQFDETVEQIISACPVLAKEQYIKRHGTVCVELHCNVCKEMGENHKTTPGMTMYRHLYKQVMKIKLPYCGTNSAN